MILRTNKIEEGIDLKFEGDNFILNRAVNINPVLEANYHARKDAQNGWARDKSYRRYASVPMEVLLEWKKEYPEILSGDAEAEHSALSRILDRPENEIFMTVEKKVGRTL